MTGDAVLSVEGLRRTYGRVQALSGLTFSVPRGAFFGLFGRNGAGKTTTLDVVTGLRTRDAGRVTILGEDLGLEPSPEVKGRIGYVAGHLELYGWMTCAEHIELVRKFYATWDADRERQLLALFHIPLQQKVATLSAGQAAQLQLLMALAHRPELLLIDEPGNLDAVVRQRLMTTMIEAIADQETTVVMASHILSELDGVCDHMCIIHNGRALAVGPVEELTARMRRLHLGNARTRATTDGLPQNVVSLQWHDGSAQVVVDGYTPELADRLQTQFQAGSCDVERIGLQDLFVALTAEWD